MFFEAQSEFDAEAHRQVTQYLKNLDGVRTLIIEFVRRIREQMQCEKATVTNRYGYCALLEA